MLPQFRSQSLQGTGKHLPNPERGIGWLIRSLAATAGFIGLATTVLAVLPTEISVLKFTFAPQTQQEGPGSSDAAILIQVSYPTSLPKAEGRFFGNGVSEWLGRTDDFTLVHDEVWGYLGGLEKKYPAGAYTLELGGGVEGTYTIVLDDEPHPAIPAITNFDDLQRIEDPNSALIQWDLGPDVRIGDEVTLLVYNSVGAILYMSPLPGMPGSLNIESTEVRINLPPEHLLQAALFVTRITDTQLVNNLATAIVVARSAMLEFSIRTLAYNPVAPEFLEGPVDVEVDFGKPVSLGISINPDATKPVAYEWFHDGYYATDDDNNPATFTIDSCTIYDAGDYHVKVSNRAGSSISRIAVVTVRPRPAPRITQQPLDLTIAAGEPFRIGILIDRSDGATYQWQRNGIPLAGPHSHSPYLSVPGDLTTEGEYNVIVSWDGQSMVSDTCRVIVDPDRTLNPVLENRLCNLSLRARIGAGESAVIVGYVIEGTIPKHVLLRGIGPKLTSFGILDCLSDPVLQLRRNGVLLAQNDDYTEEDSLWDLASVTSSAGAFPLDSGGRDSVLLATVNPGIYTARVFGKSDEAGVGMAEIYEVDRSNSVLTNLSARAFVGTGSEVLIPGFVLRGDSPQTFLIRAIGPGLDAYGVPNTLDDPHISLRSSQSAVLSENDNWAEAGNSVDIVAISSVVGAFGLDPGSRDSALLVALNPGAYTVVVSGADGGTGITLAEIYLVREE
ncbi:MAG: hypothetical protein DRP71_11245 [Verrucomicrobia bacterium]|nr:MAG: hypothetical protein DRP71_11245 [Verrucomicrobiota bacterium]